MGWMDDISGWWVGVTRTFKTQLSEEKMKSEGGEGENDAQKVGRKTNLDARPPCQHDLLRLVVQKCRVSQPLRFTTEQFLRLLHR